MILFPILGLVLAVSAFAVTELAVDLIRFTP